jgi:LysM repeat protein
VVLGRVTSICVVAVACAWLPSCGEDTAGAPAETLPPLNTTTSTTTTVFVPTTVQRFYVIKRGDTLSKIADSFDVRLEDLKVLNGIVDENNIQAGQEIEIPSGAVVLDTLPSQP